MISNLILVAKPKNEYPASPKGLVVSSCWACRLAASDLELCPIELLPPATTTAVHRDD